MPRARPTLSDLRNQASSDVASALPGADALLRYSNIGILAQIVAAMVNGLYGYLDWTANQAVPFTATDEYLEAWAALKGVTRKPAAPATGTATFTGADGAVIPAGTPIDRGDGVAFVSTASATIAGGSAVVPITATSGGATANGVAGVTLILAVGISGVSPSGVGSIIGGGTEVERDDELRSRMLAVYASPPQGGSRSDYADWALAVPGVTRAWALPGGMGPGTVLVQFMMDDDRAAFGGFPQGSDGVASTETRDAAAAGDQLVVAEALFVLQSATALVYAVAPIANVIGLTIAGIAGVGASVKAAIAVAVTKALTATAKPGSVTPLSSIEAAISSVAGAKGFVITGVTASHGAAVPAGVGNITSDANALPTLGAIAYF